MLPIGEFLNIVDKTPLVSIDLIFIDDKNRVLVGKRKNAPAKGYWFVPGGRIFKNELWKNAITRISKEECGLNVVYNNVTLIGIYDHIYPGNVGNIEGVNSHYVAIGLCIKLCDLETLKTSKKQKNEMYSQHSDYKWMDLETLMNDDYVHQNTKQYLLDM